MKLSVYLYFPLDRKCVINHKAVLAWCFVLIKMTFIKTCLKRLTLMLKNHKYSARSDYLERLGIFTIVVTNIDFPAFTFSSRKQTKSGGGANFVYIYFCIIIIIMTSWELWLSNKIASCQLSGRNYTAESVPVQHCVRSWEMWECRDRLECPRGRLNKRTIRR